MKQWLLITALIVFIFCIQIINAQGIIVDDFLVNDDTVSVDHNNPAVIMNSSGEFIIVWNDERHGWDNWDIFFQRYNSNGNLIETNVRVNNDVSISPQVDPTIAMNDVGNFVIAWEDEREGFRNIYYQLFDSNGNPIGSNEKANDAFAVANDPAVAMDDAGNFVITWRDYRNTGSDIFFQLFNSNGNKIGANVIANDTLAGLQEAPSIGMDGSGNFIIAWKDFRNGSVSDIYMQRFNSSGSSIGLNVRVDDDAGNVSQYISSVGIDGGGNFVVVWDDDRGGNEIYFQMFNSSGSAIGTNVKVSDDIGNSGHGWPSVSMIQNGDFVITWMSYIDPNYPDVEAQRYFANGTTNGGNYLVVEDGPNEIESVPVVAANSTQMAFAWTDNRRTIGRSDTFGKLVAWNWNGVTDVETTSENIPKEFSLSQNYPNPFNPSTKIKFTISTLPVRPSASPRGEQAGSPFNPSPNQEEGNRERLVTLKVYDVLGNEVATLVNKELPAGEYEVEFNAKDLISGVYLYQIIADKFSKTQKMLLLK